MHNVHCAMCNSSAIHIFIFSSHTSTIQIHLSRPHQDQTKHKPRFFRVRPRTSDQLSGQRGATARLNPTAAAPWSAGRESSPTVPFSGGNSIRARRARDRSDAAPRRAPSGGLGRGSGVSRTASHLAERLAPQPGGRSGTSQLAPLASRAASHHRRSSFAAPPPPPQ